MAEPAAASRRRHADLDHGALAGDPGIDHPPGLAFDISSMLRCPRDFGASCLQARSFEWFLRLSLTSPTKGEVRREALLPSLHPPF